MEIKHQIRIRNVQPAKLVDISMLALPQPFEVIEGPERWVKYPFKTPIVVPLYVAKQYFCLDLNDVDFVFHGSAMSWLAKRNPPPNETLRAVKIPHTNVISVYKDREYAGSHLGRGFQFESLVTGKELTHLHGMETIEHLHVVKFKQFTILLCAEVDTIGQDGSPVEITVSNWIHDKIFHMISNGSTELCHGVRNYTASVQHIQMMALSSLIENGFGSNWVENVATGLVALKNASFADGEACQVVFGAGGITFEKIADAKVMPSEKVLEDLLCDDSRGEDTVSNATL
jgi:hypothetical protein